jgi:predicted ATPase/signal transduction histidine kinase/CheY-like chemotaxis protein
MNVQISGYHMHEQVYESQHSLVYRAYRDVDRRPVVLKMLRDAYPTPEQIARFKREYEVTRSMHLPGVIEVYTLESSEHQWVMVIEDFGGDSLTLLEIAGQIPIADLLTVAINIAEIVSRIHQQHIIHKDVNPSNIVLNRATGQVKIIDFGISTALSQENPTFHHPNILEGTLPYLSPEQTGRMNRVVDYRTDLYSLGATLYELLTGRVPFLTTDPLEVLHCHIAKYPPAPNELKSAIPRTLSEIVLKLLAKNAEDRYQSASGLKTDLEECLRQWQSSEKIDAFPLGRYDVSEQFHLPQKLYGREAELETLQTAFERVSQGTCEMMVVTGYAGIGKTVLVQEVYRPITRQRGYFVSGKFDQLQRNIPYAALIQAFRALIRLLLMESEPQIAIWRKQLLAALGPNGQVVIDVIPEVALIIGLQPEVIGLAPVEAQNRFHLVFQNFIRVFAQPEHPLVVFLDDLQWADGASLKLIRAFMTGAVSQCLFLIGAYRDVEVSAVHPLSLTLKEMQQAGAVVNQIALTTLDLPNVTQFVADTLRCMQESDDVSLLSELVLAKTDGNPFFVGEFLKSLHAEGLIAFDHTHGRYGWEMERIRTRGVTTNVVELMASKIQQLGLPTQRVLQLAACVGNRFDLKTLSIVHQKSPHDTAIELRAALVEGLVLPLSDAYKLMEVEVAGLADEISVEYRFAHDRIQQAAYSLIPEADRQAIYWQIGQLLLRHIPPDEREPRIFDIVNQLNQGWAFSADQAERDELAELNLLAGQRAKSAAAYEPAFNYLQVGLDLLGADAWQRRYDLALALYVETAEAAYLIGDFEEMERLAGVVLQQAKTLLDQVKIYEVKVKAYTAQSRPAEAVEAALQMLELLGVSLPKKPSQEDVMLGLQEAASAFAGKHITDLIDLPEMKDPLHLAAMRILLNVVTPAYQFAPELMVLLVSKIVNLSAKYGNAPASASGYADYAMILCGVLGDIETGYQFGQLALSLVERLHAEEFRARIGHEFNYFIRHWKEHLRETIPPLLEAYQNGLKTGDFVYATYALSFQGSHAFFIGKELSGLEQELASYTQVAVQLAQKLTVIWNQIQRQVVLNLLGQAEDPCCLSSEAGDEQVILSLFQQTNNRSMICFMHFNKLFLGFLFQAYPQAVESAAVAERNLDAAPSTVFVPLFHFYDSLSQLAMYPASQETEQERILEKVTASQEKMKTWAQHAPMNHLHKFYLVEAERARVLGRAGEAREYYDQAIALAKEHGYVNEEALAQELAGQFYQARGQEQQAQLYLRNAHYAYQLWGAAAKVNELEQRYPQWLSSKSLAKARALTDISTDTASGEAIDFAAVLKASQAISGEIVLETLLTRLMAIVIENAGAETGLLLFEEGETWVVKAEGGPTRQTFPAGIINYVARTKESVVLNDAVREGQFTQDSYILTHQPKSVLCTPLINQGCLVGILYLENNLTTGAFTPDRLEVLQLLSSQAAISIEHAALYTTLEQKVAERTLELARAKDAADAANRAKSEFLANMSHELRTPLNAILGFAQILARSPRMPAEEQDNLSIIQRNGDHLLTLINQVLDLSKIEAGRITLNETNFDLYGLLDELEDLFRFRAAEKRLHLRFERSPDVPRYVYNDGVKLRQVLINLLNNAIKFTKTGRVELRIKNEELQMKNGESPKILHSQFLILHFSVADTGPGIAPEELGGMFEPFVQTKTGRDAHEGTGLGLPISRKFVQLMGGDITVQSEVGRGTTVTFTIPCHVGASIEQPPSTFVKHVLALEPGQPRYRLLIVDDHSDNRAVLVKLLAPLGFDLREVTNGQEAITLWDQWHPHLIWMDLRMPVMGGYEAVKKIRNEELRMRNENLPERRNTKYETPNTVIIALSASSFDEERTIALSKECDDFLRKPFRENDILEMLKKHLGVRFVYEEERQMAKGEGQDDQDVLTLTALAGLPPKLLADLEYTVTTTDIAKITALLTEIRQHDPTLAEKLMKLVEQFDYVTILVFIQKAKQYQ